MTRRHETPEEMWQRGEQVAREYFARRRAREAAEAAQETVTGADFAGPPRERLEAGGADAFGGVAVTGDLRGGDS